MNINLKIGLASLGTLIVSLIVGVIGHNWHETNELIRSGEAISEATKELEKTFAEDRKTFEQTMEKLNEAERTQDSIEKMMKVMDALGA